jgi:hypothetical protein
MFASATPGPQPPARRRGRLVWAVVATVAVITILLGGGAFATGVLAGRDYENRSPNTLAKLPPATSVALGDGQALRAYLMPSPSGAHALTMPDSAFGVQTPSQFATTDFAQSIDETAWLTGRHLEVVAGSDWLGSDGVQVDTRILQFHDANGAYGYVTGQHSAFETDPTVTNWYGLATTANADRFEMSHLDKAGDRRVILLGTDGPIALFMEFFTPHAFDAPAELAAYQRQFAALTQ